MVGIIVLASILRLWQLGGVPPSPDWDEAALGYNAYSIAKTGRDEYGTFLPLTLRSYDDYKPPLYVYLAVPFIALFGLDTWAVRLPSAILGISAVFGTYLLARELVRKWHRKDEKITNYFPCIAALLLAISPWHIQFSRIAFEANVGTTLNVWALAAFFVGLRNKWWLTVSAFLFGLALYAYHSERIFVPLLLILLALIFRRELFQTKKYVGTAIIIGIVTVTPLLPVFFNTTTFTRLAGTSSLADQTALLSSSVKRLGYDRAIGDTAGLLFDNRRIVWMKKIVEGYVSHFSLRWLFLTGDNERHHAPDMGLMYLMELPFFLYGIYATTKHGGMFAWFLIGWLLIAPVAASPTTELPHAIRTLVFLPVLQLITAFGLLKSYAVIAKSKRLIIRLAAYFFIGLFVINIIYYLHMYFVHMNLEFSKSWQYGYKQAVEFAQAHKSQYKKIVVSTKLEQPHMFFLFYTKYDPAKYLAEGGTVSGGFEERNNRFDVYEFRTIQWDREIHDGNTLYIGTPGEIPSPGTLTISYLNGSAAILISH